MLTYRLVPPTRPPPATEPGRARSCLILHGLGDSLAGWLPVVGMLDLPEFTMVLANAPTPYHDGYSWFDISPDFSPDLRQIARSRSAIDALIDHLLRELSLPSEQLFLLGFSQGSLMCVDVALHANRRFAGVVGISGFLALDDYPGAFGTAAAHQRLFLSHGLHDQLIPIGFARRQRDELDDLGISCAWHEYAKSHTLDTGRELSDIRAFLTASPSRARTDAAP